MPRIFEDKAKALLAEAGVPVPRGRAAATAEEARAAARELGGAVMVKALVPAGKRGKAGAILPAETPDAAGDAARGLLGRTVHHFPVRRVLVEEKLAIAREWYLSIAFESRARGPVVMFSPEGGVEIEELLADRPGALRRLEVDILDGLPVHAARELLLSAGLRGKAMAAAAEAIRACYRLFRRAEARVLEVNPLVETAGGEVVAAACVFDADGDALFRQGRVAELLEEGSEGGWRPPTPLERRVAEVDAALPPRNTVRFTEFEEGDIALLWSGGGGGLYLLDTVHRLGGRPATAFDITPGPLEEKYCRITRAILERPGVRGALAGSNITSFSRVQLKVRAIVRALRETGTDPRRFPFIIRFAGAGEEEARAAAAEMPGLQYLGDEVTLEEAAERIVRQVGAVREGLPWREAEGAR